MSGCIGIALLGAGLTKSRNRVSSWISFLGQGFFIETKVIDTEWAGITRPYNTINYISRMLTDMILYNISRCYAAMPYKLVAVRKRCVTHPTFKIFA